MSKLATKFFSIQINELAHDPRRTYAMQTFWNKFIPGR